jgi:hypothetical protein
MTEAEIKRKLKGRVAVPPGELPQRALGLGRHRLLRMIAEGAVPVNGVGNIPTDWLLQQMKIKGGKAA